MTEASENECLVRVRAQVMCRDEGTGGWVALGGGGLADVVLGRRPARRNSDALDTDTSTPTPSSSYEYYIHGRRISDNVVVLECTLMKDFDYHKVMPTFHHWVTDAKKFGLTFQTAADARAFDKVVRVLTEGQSGCSGLWPSVPYTDRRSDSKVSDEENQIFECLNLPTESRSSSENSSASRGGVIPMVGVVMSQTPILAAIAPPPRHPLLSDVQYDDKSEDSEPDRCPYVHLSAVREYNYTQGGPVGSARSSPNTNPPLLEQDPESLKKATVPRDRTPVIQYHRRLKCRHCQEWYIESANGAGACEFAPDCYRSCIDAVSCIKCAQCMVYHCMSDPEGEFVRPCGCGPPDRPCAKRWLGLAFLSLLVPCLCCYPPLRLSHRMARSVRLTGGHHAPHY